MYLFYNDVRRSHHSVKDVLVKWLGLSGSGFSVDDNLYFTSIGSTASRLYSSLKVEYFVEENLLTRLAKSIPSLIDDYFNGFSSNTFTRDFFTVLLCLSTKPLNCGQMKPC